MPVQVSVGDSLIHGRKSVELEEAVREGLIIRDYITGEISIGEVKELMGFLYMDDAMDWLHKKGIATMRGFNDPDLKKAQKNGFEKLKQEVLSD